MMAKRWIGAAWVAWCLSLPTTASAQQWSCGQVGPAIPGPLSSAAAPRVPLDDLGLPVGIPNAFENPPCPPCSPCEVYVFLGGMGLQRQSPGRATLAVLNTTGEGGPSSALNPPVQRFDDVWPNMMPGGRATVGIRQGLNSWEISGFYIPQNEARHQVVSAGQLDTFFVNPPAGFEGTAGLWRHANLIRTTLRDSLVNAEFNCRRTLCPGFEILGGLRYLELVEQLRMFTDDDGFGIPPTVLANQATYTLRTFNRLSLVQFGFEAACFVPCTWNLLAIGCGGKGAWGINWVRADENLMRGDGFLGFDNRQNTAQFSQVYEVGAFLDFVPAERLRVRCGYQALWLLHTVLAPNNLDFNLGAPFIIQERDGQVFFHGPLLELQLLF